MSGQATIFARDHRSESSRAPASPTIPSATFGCPLFVLFMNANKLIPLSLMIPFALTVYGCAEEREPLTDLEPTKEWGELTPEEKGEFCGSP